MGLLDNCKSIFHTDNLYDVLGVEKKADSKQIKKAYHKKSLSYHPDRVQNEDKKSATLKFQILGRVYSILSCEESRSEYDETGCVQDETSVDQDRDWVAYWRLLFPKITPKDIQEFEAKYKCSDEEREDLQRVYVSSEGDWDSIMEGMFCSTTADEPRYTEIISSLIAQGKVPEFSRFTQESKQQKNKRAKKAAKEAKEAEKEAKRLKIDDSESSLMAAITQRQAARASAADDFLSQLEAKYGGKKTKKSKR